ncbi:hypothetical protein O6P43_032162 [Quillaja saponaria]|uniref:Uncharacterized protein n=1 Tax=Quillaja saponaria TaxID=32244 RepID=A0AAD7KX10_QUISA|nr:hypothetical protein O6P43_032162 [Quillaja saponaria]
MNHMPNKLHPKFSDSHHEMLKSLEHKMHSGKTYKTYPAASSSRKIATGALLGTQVPFYCKRGSETDALNL